MSIARLASAAVIVVGGALLSGPTMAAFMPVIDEFWIVKNSNEIFRDSFNDGIVPPSGPDTNPTYAGSGFGGFTGESGGKLTMTPALGEPTVITGATSDTFTGAIRRRSTTPGTGASLDLADSFAIHGLFDLAQLPGITGQSFGIRATDRALNLGNEGDNTIQLSVVKSATSGDIGIRLAGLDFIADTIETAAFVSIESFLSTALQIELIISKQAGTDLIDASFILYDSAGIMHQQAVDTIGNVTGDPLRIYQGEDYIRGEFMATDTGIPVPEPATLALLALGLAGIGAARRRK